MTFLQIITSAAYVEAELAIEFGQIPPAFLPVGVSRLYEAQIAQLRRGGEGPTYLTIPEGFRPQPSDERRLRELGLTLVHVPQGLKLGESIVYAINVIDAPHTSVKILHGDTLIEDLPREDSDSIAIHRVGDDYSWASVTLEKDRVAGVAMIEAIPNGPVVCGFFSFSSTSLLVRSITRARGEFVAGLDLYTKERPLRAVWVQAWKDFGHIQTYFRSRRAINTARSFNTIQIDALVARKYSRDKSKIEAEANWFRSVPPKVQPYCARVFEVAEDAGSASYSMEYQHAPTLSELLVFSAIGRSTWRNILASCACFLETCAASTGAGSSEGALASLVIDKTFDRLERYATETGYNIGAEHEYAGCPIPSLVRIADEIVRLVNVQERHSETVMHGDLCFSNILYNSRAAKIVVIDPRGYVKEGCPSCFGDLRYDLAKLSHSVMGCYDYILAGRYKLTRPHERGYHIEIETGPQHAWLQRALSEVSAGGFSLGSLEVRALTIGLFLSMLPLHADRPDRQSAFIATALRLYRDLERNTV